jgi:hypothetical protein
MSVETFKICPRCQRIQQVALVVVAAWLAHGASGVQDNDLLRLALQLCAAATFAAALRFRIAAFINHFKR